MKVLHVIPSLARSDGGPSKALALMERALAAQGVEVETATTDHAGPRQHNGKTLATPLQENGVTRWYFAKKSEFYKTSPSFVSWLASNIRRFDLVHVHALFSFMPVVAARAALRAQVPYVIRPLGTLNSYGLRERRPFLKALSMKLVEGPLLRGAAAVHFTSDDEAAQARSIGVQMREAIIPLGVEVATELPPRPAREGPATLLFLSRLDPKKNLESVLGAMSLLSAEMPDLHLIVAGNGEAAYRQTLKARASAINFSPRVRWLGHVEGEDKARAFASADLFVLPSYSENFGIAAVEAMAAGLPVLLGEGVAISGDVVRAGAGIAVRPDAQSVADGLRRIIGDAAALETMARNARRLAAEQFSAQVMGARLKQLYTDILSHRPT